MRFRAPLLSILLLCYTPFAFATPPCALPETIKRAGIATLLIGTWEASDRAKGVLLSPEPRWKDILLNPIDRLGEKLRWSSNSLDEGAASLSDAALSLTAVSAVLVSLSKESKKLCLLQDIASIGEAAGFALLFNQSIKFLAKRERPFSRDLTEEQREELCRNKRDCVDLTLSFFSGHSTLSFAIGTAAGMIAHQRGYLSSKAAISFGLLGAGVTSYLRIAAGKHYLSDVALGALVGSSFGILVPHLLRTKKARESKWVLFPAVMGNPGISIQGAF